MIFSRRIFAKKADVQFTDLTLTAENNPAVSWQWDFDNDGQVDASEQNPIWTYDSSGTYSVKFIVSDGNQSEEKLYENYITLQRKPGIPVIDFVSPDTSDTTIVKRDSIYFSISARDTSGYDLSYQWFENDVPKSTDSLFGYRASAFFVPKTDTITVVVSNGFNTSEHKWAVHVRHEITAIEDASIKPVKFSLKQNFPNPFNPQTKIVYDIAKNGPVELYVFDITGKRVQTLVNENQVVGRHSVIVNAEDLASGLYFYKLVTPGFTLTRILLLVR